MRGVVPCESPSLLFGYKRKERRGKKKIWHTLAHYPPPCHYWCRPGNSSWTSQYLLQLEAKVPLKGFSLKKFLKLFKRFKKYYISPRVYREANTRVCVCVRARARTSKASYKKKTLLKRKGIRKKGRGSIP